MNIPWNEIFNVVEYTATIIGFCILFIFLCAGVLGFFAYVGHMIMYATNSEIRNLTRVKKASQRIANAIYKISLDERFTIAEREFFWKLWVAYCVAKHSDVKDDTKTNEEMKNV